eukprot:m.107789 g.107789  ORF g.107789 m.107789 type:complete len:670 (-) comp14255_c1_seq1:21-2030(-)
MAVVASVLKQYLRELPAPPLAATAVHALYSALRTDVLAARDIIRELPKSSYNLLGWVTLHLTHVIAHEACNFMSPHNLATLFSPTLRIPLELLLLIFDHVHELFPDIKFPFEAPAPRAAAAPNQTDCESIVPEEHSKRLGAEISLLEQELAKLHALVQANPDQSAERLEQMWSLQRDITDRKRELKRMTKPVDSAPVAVVPGRAAAQTAKPQLSISAILHTMLAEAEAQRVELVAVATHLSNQIAVENRRIASLTARLALSQSHPHLTTLSSTSRQPTQSTLEPARRTASGGTSSPNQFSLSSKDELAAVLRPRSAEPTTDPTVHALRAELSALLEDGDALRRHTQALAHDCHVSILACVSLRVQINLAATAPCPPPLPATASSLSVPGAALAPANSAAAPVFSRRWAYRTLETVSDATTALTSESENLEDEDQPAGGPDGSDNGSMLAYGSDVVECDNIELDDRDANELSFSKQVSPVPPATAAGGGASASAHVSPTPPPHVHGPRSHLNQQNLAAQAHLLGASSPPPLITSAAARPAVAFALDEQGAAFVPQPPPRTTPHASPLSARAKLNPIGHPVGAFATDPGAVAGAAGAGPHPFDSPLVPTIISVPPTATAAMAAASEAGTHPPSSESSLPEQRGERGTDSPRLDSRLSFGLLNLSGTHSTLV